MPKVCLQALTGGGSSEALAAVVSQLSSPWPEVREEAARLLYECEASDG